jgi:ADP-ribosyl-[dinitrogen reductase] hydrolase
VVQALKDVSDLPLELRMVARLAPTRQPADLKNSGWVRHTVESATWGLLTTGSYAEPVIQVANLGNDADTAAAIVGAMAGAAYGLSGIPADWQGRLHGRWPVGSNHVWTVDDFIRLADALMKQSIEAKVTQEK